MYIVAFNGPPRSGKDTLAQMLADHMDSQGVQVPVKFESLSMPLRKIAYEMVDWPGNLDGPDYENFKTTYFDLLGVSGRQLLIDVSEKFLKPTYGLEVMANLLLERNVGFPGVLLIRDSGFQCEVDPLVSAVGVDNIRIVQVHRKLCTFEGDSREWVFPPLGREFTRVDNNGDLADLRTEAGRIYGRLVNQYGWKL